MECEVNKLKSVTIMHSSFWWHISQLCHCRKWEPLKEDTCIPDQTHQGFWKWNSRHYLLRNFSCTLFSASSPPSFFLSLSAFIQWLLLMPNCPQSLQCELALLHSFSLLNAHLLEQAFSYSVCCAATICSYYKNFAILKLWLL